MVTSGMMARALVPLAVLALFVASTHAYYLPGMAPTNYKVRFARSLLWLDLTEMLASRRKVTRST